MGSSGSFLLQQRVTRSEPGDLRIVGRVKTLEVKSTPPRMLSEANTWSFGLYDDQTCSGDQTNSISAMDMASELTDHTVLLGMLPCGDMTIPALSTMAGKSLSVFSDAGQALCCEIANVEDPKA